MDMGMSSNMVVKDMKSYTASGLKELLQNI